MIGKAVESPAEGSGGKTKANAASKTNKKPTPTIETVEEEPSGEGEYLEAGEDTVSQDVPALMETVEEKPAGEGGEKGEETTAQVQCLNI